MRLEALPKPILVVAGFFALNAAFSTWGLASVDEGSLKFYGIIMILIVLLELVPAIGLIVRWKSAYILVLIYGGIMVVVAVASVALNIGFVIALREPWDKYVLFKLILSIALLTLGLVWYRYFRKDEIAKIYQR